MNIVKLIEKGEDALKKKNFDYAIEILLQAVSFGPNNRRAREALRKAELKKYEHSYPSAGMVAVFGLPARLGILVAALTRKGNPEGYMMACEKFLTKDPKNRKVNMALGDAAAIAGHLEAAIFAYETASEADPNDVTALKKLGSLLWKNGQIHEAHEVYDRAVRLNPHDQEAVKARKNLAAESSLKETGFETAKSSRELVRDKDAAGKLEQEGRLYQTEEDLATQRAKLEEQAAANEGDEDVLQKLAEICRKMQDWDAAFAALDKAIAAHPGNHNLKFARGDLEIERLEERRLAHLRDGQKDAADKIANDLLGVKCEQYRERVKIYPTDLNVRFKLGDILFSLGRTDEAIAEFQQTVRDPKFRSESQLRLGRGFKAKAQYDLALRQLEQALEGQSGMSDRVKEIRYERGDIYERMGDSDHAREEFGKIYEFDINYKDVGDRLHKLDTGKSDSKLSLD